MSVMQRTNADGVWESSDGGTSWVLIEPSEEFLNRPEPPLPEPAPDPVTQLEAEVAELRLLVTGFLNGGSPP